MHNNDETLTQGPISITYSYADNSMNSALSTKAMQQGHMHNDVLS